MTTEERWVGVEDVATHLGVNKDSIYRWIEKAALPAHRVGRLFRFKLSEVDDWVRSGGASEANNPSNVEKKGMTNGSPATREERDA
ncbi:MAG: DNA-binding protein [Candidatus Abyssobacteria bacterium SURF_17]|uniref:DNA-binding protein n=1 Tax=Candidatus Abyssobacteria bacterium SURF_17 TaxID=2093361 RepID=A0A419ERC2_9BACT|nr:MAG: DNA-binding protein [Candidatus Abyssubacteria bacterium SURF_17]